MLRDVTGSGLKISDSIGSVASYILNNRQIFTTLTLSELGQNIGSYLIQRLYDHGVRHIFGVPGDFVLGFYQVK